MLWKRDDVPGLEHCRLEETAEGPRLVGTVLLGIDGAPLQVEYKVACSRAWETRSVRLMVIHGGETRRAELAVDDDGRWWRGGEELATVVGCRDVDLSVSPSTNTLPIRRLAIPIGESRDVTAAWVRFPELTVEPLPQRYTRLSERRFRYESRAGAFTAEVEVDDLGLVVRYPPLWERVG